MNFPRFALILVLTLTGCGRFRSGKEDVSSSAKEPELPAKGLLLDLVEAELPRLEALLVDLANRSIDKHDFDQKKSWHTGSEVRVDNHLDSRAKAKMNDFAIVRIGRLAPTEYFVTFQSKVTVSNIDLHYYDSDGLKASVSNAELPALLGAGLYVHWAPDVTEELAFLPGDDKKFVQDVSIVVTSFDYEDTFLKDLPHFVREDVRIKARETLDDMLAKKDDSVAKKLDADLNKIAAKDKIDVHQLLEKLKEKVEEHL